MGIGDSILGTSNSRVGTRDPRAGTRNGGGENASDGDPLAAALAEARAALAAGIAARQTPAALLRAHSSALDAVVRAAWREAAPGQSMVLFAIGGYGRRELYPRSDIDLAVVLDRPAAPNTKRRIERFVQRLWDLDLKAGIGVRTLTETRAAAAEDASTYTALREARRLAGARTLVTRFDTLLAEETLWPTTAYIRAKHAEQRERHARYGDSTQRLEPSVKEGPGGLRDLATIGWIAARHLGLLRAGPADLERAGLVLAGERRALAAAWRMLARVRLCLHYLAGRNEERLLFDLQPRIAELLGYHARPGVLAVERLMQDYYRASAAVARANALTFATLEAAPGAPVRTLATGLVAHGATIDFDRPERLRRQPGLMFSIFARWQREPALTDLAPAARRAITSALPHVAASLRKSPNARADFLGLLQAPDRVAAVLAAMHETGLLKRYLPAFARIAGRMQYDLFHVFTVDEHVLRVVANSEALLQGEFKPASENLLAAARRIDRREILYLAALFHDIAKGRGGDHSTLGSRDARHFSRRHGLTEADAELVAWLVGEHLTLSTTAQKSDLSDPRVIAEFTRRVGDQRHLDYLYVLTAADVQATNPSLWNAWRAALFSELYQATSRALWRGLDDPVDAAADISARKTEARALLGGGNSAVVKLWKMLGDSYFLQYQPEEIAWHTRVLLAAAGPPAVFLRPAPAGVGTAIAVYSSRKIFGFARVTAVLAELGLTILAARCVPVGAEDTFDTYLVREADGSPIEDPERLRRVQTHLEAALAREAGTPARVTPPTPRQVRLFRTPTRIVFASDPAGRHTVLELHAGDRPGLLAAVGRSLRRSHSYLRTARIMTAGERAEDVFHITDAAGRPLEATARDTLARILEEEIAAEG
ncbi:MAG: [protein-PII] uridylyltransferase [Gammaproteobacteria bacterium]